MLPRTSIRVVGALLLATADPRTAAAAPLLRAADVAIDMPSPSRCEVALAVTLEEPPVEVTHHLETLDGAIVAVLAVDGGSAGAAQSNGRIQVLQVTPAAPTYTLRYRVEQPQRGAFRCPIWLPVTPADGRSRAVRIAVTVPDGATAAGTFPAFSWTGRTGRVTLGHLPAFVHVPFAAAGVAVPWSLDRLMDGLSLAVLVAATLVWWRWRRR